MRQRKVITIDDRKIEVKEITVREIRNFWQDVETEPTPGFEGFYNVLTRFMPTCVEGMAIEDIDDMAPSDLKKVFDAFKEVNAVFFEAARLIEGGNPIVVGLRQALAALLTMRFADLLPLVMKMYGITDTASSLQRSES